MNDDRWTGAIRSVGATAELLAVVKSYVATWDKPRLALLPADCRPPPLETADDLTAYAVTLVRRQMSPGPVENREVLEEMAAFFAAAHVRLAEIFAASRPATARALLRQLFFEDE